ncbi:MAG: substrate-binding domain-containing protein [Saprospiraceae bacterium]|nr:substrate-binding domain-containing protein [Saprospiraceae bacterium]
MLGTGNQLKIKRNTSFVAKTLVIVSTIMLLINGCSDSDKADYYKGDLRIGVDENLKPLLEPAFQVFENNSNGRYKTQTIYLPESQLFDSFNQHKIATIVSLRKLKDFEKMQFKAQNLYPIETLFGADAVALIANIQYKDSCLSIAQVKDLFSEKNNNTPIVFDNNGSSNINFVLKELSPAKLTGQARALNSNEEVINYITNKTGGIGVIGTAWLSNLSVSEQANVMRKIKFIKIKSDSNRTNIICADPSQEHLIDSTYKLSRQMWVINRKQLGDAGSGFASFIAGEIGQRIILKAGLMPLYPPGREIIIKR